MGSTYIILGLVNSYKGEPENQNLFIKNYRVFTLTCLHFSHRRSTLHLMQYTYQDIFSTAQSSFWTHWLWCLLVLLPFSVSPRPQGQMFPFENFFHLGKEKKLLGMRLGEYGGWDTGVRPLLFKNCWTLSVVWAGMLVNHPSWNDQIHWKSLQKNSLKPNTASHNNASWCTNVDGFLT